MRKALTALDDRLAPVEELFFAWLIRVFVAATLVGSAWIDDAPPLELGAFVMAIYVGVRVVTQFSNLADAAPFKSRVSKSIFAVGAMLLLGLSFVTIVIFVRQLSLSATG